MNINSGNKDIAAKGNLQHLNLLGIPSISCKLPDLF